MLRNGPSTAPLPDDYGDHYFPTCLILSPTRELALQIYQESQRVGLPCLAHSQFCYCTGIASAVVYGGTPMREVLDSLRSGCDILVGTPGRVKDLIQRGILGLEGITFPRFLFLILAIWCWTKRTACWTWASSRRSATSWSSRACRATGRRSCSPRRSPTRSSASRATSSSTTSSSPWAAWCNRR